MSQFWQKRQARLQPAVPNDSTARPGQEVVQRLLLDRIDAEPRRATVARQDDRVAAARAHETQAALALVQPALARAEIALDPAVVETVPVPRRDREGIHEPILGQLRQGTPSLDRGVPGGAALPAAALARGAMACALRRGRTGRVALPQRTCRAPHWPVPIGPGRARGVCQRAVSEALSGWIPRRE